ncbi:MAG TPA: endonuclease, partial [Dehalococcoidia bacterium]|nr:endonuclease [Dehalococcoidia bacterium]
MSASPPAFSDVVSALEVMHCSEFWHWTAESNPFEVVVGAILVQHTNWTNAERALARLRLAGILEPKLLAGLTDKEIEELIRSSGEYHTKAKKLRAFLCLIARYGSLEALLEEPVHKLRDQLLDTWGIGEETADAIVLYAARQPAVVVDGYTRRLFGRLGLGPSPSDSYREWQAYLKAELPESV